MRKLGGDLKHAEELNLCEYGRYHHHSGTAACTTSLQLQLAKQIR